jgi:hypothetical protein
VFKRFSLTEPAVAALEKRGVPDLTAELTAELGIRAYYRAYEQWAESTGEHALSDFIRRSLEQLRVWSATLD